MPKRAFAYARTSKEDKNKRKWSIATQFSRIHDRADREGWEIVSEFEDRDLSGDLDFPRRPGWSALEKQLKSGDLIIVADTDRLARDDEYRAKFKMKELWETKQVGVIILEKSSIDISTADGTFMLDIDLAISARERNKIIERLKFTHKQIHKEGKALGCRPLLGYDYDTDAKVWSINDEQAEVVRRIFALKVSGYGFQAIAKKLRAEGIPTKRGGGWTTNTIKRIVENRWYIAEREYLDEVKPLKVPMLIDKETWEMAQASIRHQVHRPKSTYALSGILYCTLCGHVLYRVRRWAAGEANGEADWRCQECGHLAIREKTVEPTVIEAFFAHLDSGRYEANVIEAQKTAKKGEGRAALLKKRLDAVERKQSRLIDELAKDDTTLTRDAFANKNREWQVEIDELESAIQELEDTALLNKRPKNLGNIREDWDVMDVPSKQVALRAFIARVDILSPNGVRGADRVTITWR
jgi:site-specific DNA recombinase